MTSQSKKVYVGLSGGVDSSVSAALLKKAGYDVTGVFIKVWQPDWIKCNWKEERHDAMRVCAHLNIPFITLDLEKEYKQDVIDYMIREYKNGRTPNPDVMCNRYVKFGGFLKWAKEQGADYVATGHYAKVERQRVRGLGNRELGGDVVIPKKDYSVVIPAPDQSRGQAPTGIQDLKTGSDLVGNDIDSRLVSTGSTQDRGNDKDDSGNGSVEHGNNNNTLKLFAGVDKNKDQSYFLWTLNQKDLPYVLFPVGHLTKPEVRKLAEEFGLPTASKKDSQGLCFIGKVDVKEFLSHYIKSEVGNVLNEKGEAIGTHSGALFFTNGERRGFVIDHKNKTPNDLPYFVIDKDVEQNTITVSNMAGDTLPGGEKRVTISNVNWVSGSMPEFDVSKEFLSSGQFVDSDEVVGKLAEHITNSSLVNFPLLARSRYRQPLQKIRIVEANISEVTLEFEQVQDTLTPGQSLVIYDGEECLGGGVIC